MREVLTDRAEGDHRMCGKINGLFFAGMMRLIALCLRCALVADLSDPVADVTSGLAGSGPLPSSHNTFRSIFFS